MNKDGRPLLFETPEALEAKINEYFESCFEEVWYEEKQEDKSKKWVPQLERDGSIAKVQTEPFTISGLSYYLGVDRKTLINYEKRDEYFHTIKKAKARIEAYTEKQLFNTQGKNMVGIIFNLKNNYGWQDKTEMDMNVAGSVQIVDDIPLADDDE